MEIFPFFNNKNIHGNKNEGYLPQKWKYPNLAPLKKDEVTFRGKKELTEADIKEKFPYVILNEFNIPLAKRILADERLYKNPDFMAFADEIVHTTDTEEKAQIQNDLFDKVLSDENLYDNLEFMQAFGEIAANTKTADQKEIADFFLSDSSLFSSQSAVNCLKKAIGSIRTKEQKETAKKVFSEKKLNSNPNFMEYAGDIIRFTRNKRKKEMADFILADERLVNNPEFMKYAAGIILNTENDEQKDLRLDILNRAMSDESLSKSKPLSDYLGSILFRLENQEQKEVADKILSNKKLYDNPNFMPHSTGLVYRTKTPKQKFLALSFLSDERIYDNPDFIKKASGIIKNTKGEGVASIKLNVMNQTLSDEALLNDSEYMKCLGTILSKIQSRNQGYNVLNLLCNYKKIGFTPNQIPVLISDENGEMFSKIQQLNQRIGIDNASKLTVPDTELAVNFLGFEGKKDINEFSIYGKRILLRQLISANADLFNQSDNFKSIFPLLPKNQEEYCALLPAIVSSLGIETKPLTIKEKEEFNRQLHTLSGSLKKLSDNEFNAIKVYQTYGRNKFICDVIKKTEKLTKQEKQKVYDYFGFEITGNEKAPYGYTINGYPANPSDSKKLAKIKDSNTRAVIESLRENVIQFTEENTVKCTNKEIEAALNAIVKYLPEIRTQISKIQAGNQGTYTSGSHDFDVMKHSLKVIQKMSQDKNFSTLSEKDKQIMLLAGLTHDIRKQEGYVDRTHPSESAFDTFFIAKKFNLSQDEEIKLYTIIKHHEWLPFINKSQNEEQLKERYKSTAYDLRYDNVLDLLNIFTHADLRAVKNNDSFHDSKYGSSKVDIYGNIRSYGESCDYYTAKLKTYIKELQKSQPVLPVTKIPNSDTIKNNLHINPNDGTTDVKGVYVDKDGLVIIKFNEVEDFEKIGFEKGSISRGIKGNLYDGSRYNTGNIKFLVHGLDYESQLSKFDAFSLIDSDALLSVSYAERPESKYRFFRPQGVILDVNTEYIHGGGNTDAGSGCKKDIDLFKKDYIFGGEREADRLYISNLIKEAAGLSDDEYIQFVKQNENKSFMEIEPEELREKIIKAFAAINSNSRTGNREYNEMYISNPKPPMAVFAYGLCEGKRIDNPIEFLNSDKNETEDSGPVKERTGFLRKYALEHNVPFIIFGP